MLATTTLTFLPPPLSVGRKLRRHVLTAFLDALLTWLTVQALAAYTLHHLHPGNTYIFSPRGPGLLCDALIQIVLFTAFFLLYTLPAFLARPWLGWILRVLMFGLFGLYLTFMTLTKIIAVVETPEHKIIFYPHYPFAPRVYDAPPNAEYHHNAFIEQLNFLTGQPEDLMLYPVFPGDSAGRADLDRLRHRVLVVKERE